MCVACSEHWRRVSCARPILIILQGTWHSLQTANNSIFVAYIFDGPGCKLFAHHFHRGLRNCGEVVSLNKVMTSYLCKGSFVVNLGVKMSMKLTVVPIIFTTVCGELGHCRSGCEKRYYKFRRKNVHFHHGCRTIVITVYIVHSFVESVC